jgi:hypothetical protein
MGGLSRFAGFFNPARWGYEAIVQIERDGQDGYAKSPKEMVSELRQALKSVEEGTPASSFESKEPSTFLLPFDEDEENETSGDRDKRKVLAYVMLGLMSILTLAACLFKLRSAR